MPKPYKGFLVLFSWNSPPKGAAKLVPITVQQMLFENAF